MVRALPGSCGARQRSRPQPDEIVRLRTLPVPGSSAQAGTKQARPRGCRSLWRGISGTAFVAPLPGLVAALCERSVLRGGATTTTMVTRGRRALERVGGVGQLLGRGSIASPAACPVSREDGETPRRGPLPLELPGCTSHQVELGRTFRNKSGRLISKNESGRTKKVAFFCR